MHSCGQRKDTQAFNAKILSYVTGRTMLIMLPLGVTHCNRQVFDGHCRIDCSTGRAIRRKQPEEQPEEHLEGVHGGVSDVHTYNKVLRNVTHFQDRIKLEVTPTVYR